MILLWKDKEQQILSLFQKGDNRAMDKLYMEYADYLTGVCARYISNEDQLKDVLQESFIRIFTNIHQFEYRGKGSLKAWMTKVVINESLQQLRKEEAFLVPLHESQIGELPDEEPEVEGFDSQMLLAFVRKLPPGYRAVFNLFVIEEKSHQEIAEILQIKPNTSASQYLRAKKLLIEMIQEYKLQRKTDEKAMEQRHA